jgi:spermidine synthase
MQLNLQQQSIEILYQKEGILGQVMVAEIPVMKDGKQEFERTLFVNRIIQTSYNPKNDKFNDYKYFNVIGDILEKFPKDSKMLVLGLGGGVIARDAIQKGIQVDAVELDQRIIEVSREYFGLDSAVRVFRDDARHYLNQCEEQYDLVLFDLFRGEETPAHVFTAESIDRTRKILKPGGLVMINANGYYRGDIGKGTRSLYKTIRAMGLYVELYPTGTQESESNMIYLASNSRDTFDDFIPPYVQDNYIDSDSIDVNDAIILTDRRPVLDHLNEEATSRWRIGYQAFNNQFYRSYHIPMFN